MVRGCEQAPGLPSDRFIGERGECEQRVKRGSGSFTSGWLPRCGCVKHARARSMNRCTALLLAGLMLAGARANNLSITQPVLVDLNTTAGTVDARFTVSWQNSWRTSVAPGNWDAAWVFVKFRKNGGDWAHASLTDTGHTVPSGASLDVGLVDTSAAFNISTNPGVGVFIYRSRRRLRHW